MADVNPLFFLQVEGVRLVERGGSSGTSASGHHYTGGSGSSMSGRSGTKQQSAGVLYLTATHLIFVDSEAKKETWVRGVREPLLCQIAMPKATCPQTVCAIG